MLFNVLLHKRRYHSGNRETVGAPSAHASEKSDCEGKGGTQWYVVEHESSKDPIDAVRRAHAALKKMGKV